MSTISYVIYKVSDRIRGAGRIFFSISAWQGRIRTTVSMVLGAFARAFPHGREGFHASVLIDMCIKRGGLIASRALVSDLLCENDHEAMLPTCFTTFLKPRLPEK